MNTRTHKDTITINREELNYLRYYNDADQDMKEKIANTLQPSVPTINIGKNVPDGAVNIAYVGAPAITPANTVSINDLTNDINFNVIEDEDSYSMCVVDPDSYLYSIDNESSVFPKVPVSITNYYCERKTSNDPLIPLFYKYRLKNTININNLEQIKVEGAQSNFTYEIRPTKVGQSTNEYYVDIFSNIKSTMRPVKIYYIAYGSNKITFEMLDLEPCFKETDMNDILTVSDKDMFSIENSSLYSKIKVKESATRMEVPFENFKYQIESDIQVLYSKLNPGSINIGVIVVGNISLRQQDISSFLRSIQNIIPSYLTIKNPIKDNNLDSYDYWEIPASTPLEVLYMFDIVVVSGYGEFDIGATNIIDYIEDGGKVILDNCGTNENTLDIAWPEGAATEINFNNSSELSLSYLYKYDKNDFVNRVYNLESALGSFVSDQYIVCDIDILGEEDDWTKIFYCEDSAKTVIAQRRYGKGILLVSSIGLFANMAFNVMRLTANILYTIAEHKYIKSPVLVDNIIRSSFIDFDDIDYFFDIEDNVLKKKIKPNFSWLNHINQKYITEAQHSIFIYNMNNSPSDVISAEIKDISTIYVYYQNQVGINKSTRINRKYKFKESTNISINVLTYTYKYNSITGSHEYQIIDEKTSNHTINSGDITRLTDLPSLVPNIPGELYNTNIFVKVSFKKSFDRSIPANLVIADKSLSNLFYNLNGENVFPINQINDLFVYAEYRGWRYYLTNYYAIRYKDTKSLKVKLVDTDDERDCWFPEISDCYMEVGIADNVIPAKAIYMIPQHYMQNMSKKLTRSDFVYSIYNPNMFSIPYDNNDIIIIKNVSNNINFITPFMPIEGVIAESTLSAIKLKSIPQMINPEFSCSLNCLIPNIGYSVTITYYDNEGNEIDILKQYEPNSPYNITIKEYGGARSFSILIDINQQDIDAMGEGDLIQMSLTLYYLLENKNVKEDKTIYIDDHTIKVNQKDLIQESLTAYIKKQITKQVINEILTPNANKTIWTSNHKNWLYQPAPKIYNRNIQFDNIKIDYDNGMVYVDSPNPLIELSATYTYSGEEIPLTVTGIDRNNGYVNIAESINLSDNIYANYTYKNRYYTYKGYKHGNTFIHLDLNPSYGHFFTDEGIVNGMVDYINVPSINLVGRQIVLYLIPMYIIGSDNDVLQYNEWPLRHSFCTVEELKQRNRYAIPIALINVDSSANIKDITVIDSRSYGGGLKENITMDVINTRDVGSKYFWDISPWNGVAYRSNGVIVVRLPKRITEMFEETYIEEVVHKRLPEGIMPIIEYV